MTAMKEKIIQRSFITLFLVFFVLALCCVLNFSAESRNISGRIDEYLQARYRLDHFNGVALVAIKGEITLMKGYGYADRAHQVPNTVETAFRIASLTKQFTALSIMQLEEQGRLSLDDPLSRFFPDYPKGDLITVHHLLTHTSGIPDYLWFPDFERTQMLPFSDSEIVQRFWGKPLNFEPGTRFSYSNSGYFLLGCIIERLTGLSFEEYLRMNILEPLSMNRTGCEDKMIPVTPRAQGYQMGEEGLVPSFPIFMPNLKGTGDMYSTAWDLFRWDRALRSNVLVRHETLERMFAPHEEEYGYGWRIDQPFDKRRVFHGGRIDGFLCWFSRYLDEDVTIILLNNNMDIPLRRIDRDIAAIIFGQPYEIPK